METTCPKCNEVLEIENPKDYWMQAYCDVCDINVDGDGEEL